MQVRAESLVYTFSSWPKASVPIGGKNLLKYLAELSSDTLRNFRGWLGYFTSEKNALIYRIFEDYHFNHWERVIDPLWKAIIEHVKDA